MIRVSGQLAFHGCTSLATLDFPPDLVSIGYSAFDTCTSLGTLRLPAAVAVLGAYAFAECTALRVIVMETTTVLFEEVPFWSRPRRHNQFSNCSALSVVSVSDSRAAAAWSVNHTF